MENIKMRVEAEGGTVGRKALLPVLIVAFSLLMAPSFVNAAVLTTFADGKTTQVLNYTSAGEKTVNIVLPRGVSVLTARMDVTGEFIVKWTTPFTEASELLVDKSKFVPAIADLDNDGRKDLLIGASDGITYAFQNTGQPGSPVWFRRSDWDLPDIGIASAPTIADLDFDGLKDVLVGTYPGYTYAFKNTGSGTNPAWTRNPEWDVTDWGDVSSTEKSTTVPELVDLDADGDYDLLIGTRYGKIYAFENVGTLLSPSWARKPTWDLDFGIYYSAPRFADIDGDGDQDLFIGSRWGNMYGYENTGSSSSPSWKRRADWDPQPDGQYTVPSMTDLNGDGNQDILLGVLYDIKVGLSTVAGTPLNPSFNISGTTIWTYVGKLSTTTTTADFSFELNTLLSACTTPQCTIPLVFYSGSPGRLTLSNLYVEYVSLDTSPPTYTNIGQTSTVAAQPTTFHALWQDNYGLSGYIFSTNNTGTWVNDSWKPLSGTQAWTNVTKTLTSTVGVNVGWRIYVNDTSNNWGDMGVIVLTTTPPADTTPPTITIASPGNATYAITSIALEVSADEPVHTWWYSLNGGDNVIFTPNTSITAVLGSNHLLVYANDTTGNVGSKGVYFTVAPTVVTPKAIKTGTISTLTSLKSFAKKQSAKEIDNAISKIQKSLESVLWVGEDHLSVREGHRVFQNEREAVENHLMKITLGKGENADPAIASDVQGVINALVNADKLLANISINDAKSITVDPKNQKKYEDELSRAEDEMSKAQEQASTGEYGKAIDHYKKAWEHSQAAVKHGS